MALDLRSKIQSDLFDYLELTAVLEGYSNVRGKIHRLLASGEIIRIKKGIYTFSESHRRHPLNLPLVANWIYGPSYVSGDYALAYYGLIPETVYTVTSVTTGRSRAFSTPFGYFSYSSRLGKVYSVGIALEENTTGSFLIASPEKALYDKVFDDNRFDGSGIPAYLQDDLRLDFELVRHFSPKILTALADVARGRMKPLIQFLLETIQ